MSMRLLSCALLPAALLIAQPPPPSVDRRIQDIRNHLDRNPPATPQQKELAAFAEKYLADATRALKNGKPTQARQLADAADACRRPIDHLQHLADDHRLPGPPDPPDHLRQTYFRLRLCEYFLRQIPPPAPNRLLELAREFYEQAVKAGQANHGAQAGEYAKAADDLTHALESLAQAALP